MDIGVGVCIRSDRPVKLTSAPDAPLVVFLTPLLRPFLGSGLGVLFLFFLVRTMVAGESTCPVVVNSLLAWDLAGVLGLRCLARTAFLSTFLAVLLVPVDFLLLTPFTAMPPFTTSAHVFPFLADLAADPAAFTLVADLPGVWALDEDDFGVLASFTEDCGVLVALGAFFRESGSFGVADLP